MDVVAPVPEGVAIPGVGVLTGNEGIGLAGTHLPGHRTRDHAGEIGGAVRVDGEAVEARPGVPVGHRRGGGDRLEARHTGGGRADLECTVVGMPVHADRAGAPLRGGVGTVQVESPAGAGEPGDDRGDCGDVVRTAHVRAAGGAARALDLHLRHGIPAWYEQIGLGIALDPEGEPRPRVDGRRKADSLGVRPLVAFVVGTRCEQDRRLESLFAFSWTHQVHIDVIDDAITVGVLPRFDRHRLDDRVRVGEDGLGLVVDDGQSGRSGRDGGGLTRQHQHQRTGQ